MGIDDEPESRLGRARQSSKQRLGGFERLSTGLAHQVAVTHRCEVICRRTVPEVRVDDHPQTLQLLEVAVNGRHVHIRSPRLDLQGQLLGCAVPVSLEQRLEKESPRDGKPTTARPQPFERLLD